MIGLKLETNSTGLISAQNNENGLILNILPNPVRGNELTLQVSTKEAEQGLIEIKDQLGRNVVSKACYLAVGLNSITVGVEELSSGFFYVRISTTNVIITKPMIIQK